jgi:molybdenum cofactor biosynthesis protein B
VSYQSVGTSTVQSRACGGLAEGTYIFCVPGSPGACEDAWNGILRAQLDNRHRPCSFIEIIPRLLEGRKKEAKKKIKKIEK